MTNDTIESLLPIAKNVAVFLAQRSNDVDRAGSFPLESLAAIRDTPLMGLLVPESYGGAGGSLVDLATIASTLASGCPTTAFIWAMHCQQVDAIVRHASARVRDHVLPRVARGGLYLGSITSEPGKGGHLLSAGAAATMEGDVLAFERVAPIVTGGRHAEGFLITLRANPDAPPDQVTLVYADREELEITETAGWDAMGMRGTESVSLTLSGRVPAWRAVGAAGRFRDVAVESMIPAGHIGWAACWLGAAREGLRRLVGSLRRTVGNPSDAAFDLKAERLARARIDLELAHAYLETVAHEIAAARRRNASLAATATQIHLNALKVAASELAYKTAERLVEIAGLLNGYTRNASGFERLSRDLRAATLTFGNDRLLTATGRLLLLDVGTSLAGRVEVDRVGTPTSHPVTPRPAESGPALFIHDLLDRAAAEHPARDAVRDSLETKTYTQLAADSVRWAGWLASRGVGRGDRVVAALENSVSLVTLVYAASRLGAVMVPARPRGPILQLQHIVDDTDPRVVIVESEDPALRGHVVRLETAKREAASVEPFTRTCVASSADVALLIYTSGSTALPKGVVSTHRQVLFAAGAIGSRLRYGSDDTVFCCLPFSFDYGLYQVFLCAQAGAQLVIGASSDASAQLLSQLLASAATVVPLVPSLATTLIRLAERRPVREHRIRSFTFTGAATSPALRRDLRAAFAGASITLMFGLTECKRAAIHDPDGDLQRPDSVGRALPDTEIIILDPEGRRVPPGTTGEIVVRGPHVMQGYWRSPELSATRFRRLSESGEVVLFTGDFGSMDVDGYLTFVGRRDDIYKQHGMRVSTTEVEHAALAIEGVGQAAVLPPSGDAEAVLFVVTQSSAAEVLRQLGRRLEFQKVPSRAVVVDTMPLTSNGKIDRTALRARIA